MTINKQIIVRFLNKVDKSTSCWEWRAMLDKDGYGKFRIADKMEKASRVSWTIEYGDIPNHLMVLHKCDNRKCVKPDHLFLGTHHENMKDCRLKRRFKSNPKRGEDNYSSKLTKSQILEIRSKAGLIFQKDLAKLYGVTQSHISRIILKQSWRHLSE